MTREQIIELLKQRRDMHKEQSDDYVKVKIEAMQDGNLDKANKYRQWSLDSYALYSEIDFILSEIEK